MPDEGSKDAKGCAIGFGKAPAATRFPIRNGANPRGGPRRSTSLATILQRALDAPAVDPAGKRHRISKRELMIRGLVERAAGADLAATKLLFDMLRKADPPAVAPDPAAPVPLGEDALTLLKERLARLARAQTADRSATAPPRSAAAETPDRPGPAGSNKT